MSDDWAWVIAMVLLFASCQAARCMEHAERVECMKHNSPEKCK